MKNKLRILRGMLNRTAKTSDKHLSKLKCVSSKFGFDRGQPIDRLYIEHFINSNCGKISHTCGIEVGEIHYLNSINVNNKIILSHPSFTGATHSDTQILLDLNTISVKSTSSPLADIIICTNVLNFVKYPDIAMENFRNLLTQKGKLILTVSASMPISRFDSEQGLMASVTIGSPIEAAVVQKTNLEAILTLNLLGHLTDQSLFIDYAKDLYSRLDKQMLLKNTSNLPLLIRAQIELNEEPYHAVYISNGDDQEKALSFYRQLLHLNNSYILFESITPENFTEEQEKEEKKMEPPRSQEIKRWELI